MRALKLLAAGLLFFCAACKKAPQAPGKLRMGLSIPTQREERWVRDLEHLRKEADGFDVDLLVKVAQNDAAQQLAQCRELLAQNISVLIIAPHDARAAAKIVEEAAAKGVKVVSYDRLIIDARLDLFVSFDNTRVGEMQAEYLTRLAPRGNYIVLGGARTDSNTSFLHKGAMRALQPYIDRGDIRVVADLPVPDWDPAAAERIVRAALKGHNGDIQAVVAPNDATAGGAIAALEAYGLAGRVPVSGQDAEAAAARRIVKGTQSMTVFKDTRQMASAAFVGAMSLAMSGRPAYNTAVGNRRMKVPSVLLDPVLVDRDNIRRILVDGGFLTAGQVYGGE